MRIALGIVFGALSLWAVSAVGASAQVDTPPNCHWVALPDDPTAMELWCRDQEGRARPMRRMMRQGPADAWDGCPRGLIYDGAQCVSEWEAMDASARSAAPLAPLPARPERPKAKQPDIYMRQNRDGSYSRGEACTETSEVYACKTIPHH